MPYKPQKCSINRCELTILPRIVGCYSLFLDYWLNISFILMLHIVLNSWNREQIEFGHLSGYSHWMKFFEAENMKSQQGRRTEDSTLPHEAMTSIAFSSINMQLIKGLLLFWASSENSFIMNSIIWSSSIVFVYSEFILFSEGACVIW